MQGEIWAFDILGDDWAGNQRVASAGVAFACPGVSIAEPDVAARW